MIQSTLDDMNFIEDTSTDPYFNLALEEFIFYHFSEPVMRIWQNKPCVVVGKNQLLSAEIDLDFAYKNNIKIVRRFSGGGAVFQDLGNVNISFIRSDGKKSFQEYNQQLIRFLHSIDLSATTNERQAIYLDKRKVSGCAQYVRGNKSIYHATLLFSSKLDILENVLQGVGLQKSDYRYVKSVKSPVENISRFLPPSFTQSKFIALLKDYFIAPSDTKHIHLPNDLTRKINKLKDDKYQNEEWILRGKFNNI
ncbi:MAG: biotin/lipoate A/B protein ligase family protein [Paludibacteraceae bacterium]